MAIGDLMTRTYGNFRGIDLLNPANSVDLTRSPDCLNVWKSYRTTQSNMIQTRDGYRKIINLGTAPIYNMYVYSTDTALVHIGNKLIKWVGFPSSNISTEVLSEEMNETDSIMFFYNENVYILDGKNYLKYNGESLTDVADEAYVPTTTISRAPSGGGEPLDGINLLSNKRKNSFVADGTSTDYYLDAIQIEAVNKITVNDEEVTDYTVDLIFGKVTFGEAPTAPVLTGQDNVVIEFTKTVEGYEERIKETTIATTFDNRLFFSGNKDFPNAVFHCALNNPAYISDLNYYECGSKDNPIKSLVVGNNLLWVLKYENQNKDTIFYLSPTLDAEYGKIYPTSQGNVAVGCYSIGVNYQDTIVFLSRDGLEGINGNVQYEQSVSHKSSLVDSKMTNLSNYSMPKIAEYNGYLLIAIDNTIFLADNRQTFKGVKGIEYEWYLWEFPVKINFMKSYQNMLYFGDKEGNIYTMTGTNDDGQTIVSYWTTPRDAFGYINHLKTINKRGSMLKIKNIQNGKVKIATQTNKEPVYDTIKEASSNGFDFANIDFGNFTFETGENSYVVFRIKEKKIIDISIKVFSDELDKPFGLVNLVLEAFLGGYVKRS